MFKRVLAVASLAVIVANVGCGAAPDSSDSSASDQALASAAKSTKGAPTLSLADAQAQVNAIRAKFNGSNDYTLLLDESLAPAYVKSIVPIFAQVAPTDKFALAATALEVVSNPIVESAIVTDGVLDDAVGTFADLWSYSFYYGGAQSSADFYTKFNLVISHSSASPLADLQILSLATNLHAPDLQASLTALNWEAARPATAADAMTIPDDAAPYGAINTFLFGDDGYTVDPKLSHDLDMTNAFDVALFTRSYAKMRLFTQPGNDQGGNIVDLCGHLNTVEEATGHKATNAIKIADSVFSASELKILNIQLTH